MLDVRPCPRIESRKLIKRTGIQTERRPVVRPSWEAGGRCGNRRRSQDACERCHALKHSVQLAPLPRQDRRRTNDLFEDEHHPRFRLQRGKEPRSRNGIRQCLHHLGFSPIDPLSAGRTRYFIGSYGLHKYAGTVIESESGRQRRGITPGLAGGSRDGSTQKLFDCISHAGRDLVPVQPSTANAGQQGINRLVWIHNTMIALDPRNPSEQTPHLSQITGRGSDYRHGWNTLTPRPPT